MSRSFSVVWAVMLALTPGGVSGQSFLLEVSQVSAGGAYSVAGDLALVCTIGQAEAGARMTSGVQALETGFWPAAGLHNAAPTLTEIPNPAAILEDAGEQTVNLSGISAGPIDDGWQVVTVTATSSNPGLIPNPVVTYTSPNSMGTLKYTPVANANGTALITVVVQDSGGTADGGVDKATNTFVINVTAVNDAPSVTFAASTVTVLEDSGPISSNSFALFSTGPANESAQTLTVLSVANDNNALFSAQPNISGGISPPGVRRPAGSISGGTGTLTFTPAANANGSATVTVVVQDSGGTADGGVDKATNTFVINVTAVNDPPTFQLAGNVLVNENSGAYSRNSFANSVSSGPLDEASQTINFHVSHDNAALFSVPPAISAVAPRTPTGLGVRPVILPVSGGTLTFTPAANAYGVAHVTVTAQDTGGTANGGSDTSAPQQFTITVFAPPVNTVPGTQTNTSNKPLYFTATNLVDNSIRVADPDSTNLLVQLTVTNGTVTVPATNGLEVTGNGTTNLVLAGAIADLNATLQTLTYRSFTNAFGEDLLTVVSVDDTPIGGLTNVVATAVPIHIEVPTLGGIPKVSLDALNTPTRTVTNVVAVTNGPNALDTNLVQGISFNVVSNVVNVLPVGGQDGSTQRTTITVTAQFSDGTTQLITVPVIIYQPLLAATTNNATYDTTFGVPLFNLQTSLYEQKVRVQNTTPFDFTALRITATNLPPTVTLQNATLTNGGRVYIDYNVTVPSGTNVTLKLEYFSSDLKPFIPGLKLELLNTARTNAAPPGAVMTSVAPQTGYAPDGKVKNYLYFPSQAGQRYYVQYQDGVTNSWKTSGVVLTGTGLLMNWMDDGPPNTDTAPSQKPGELRIYRVLTDR